MLGIVQKQPVEVLDYDIDFDKWLEGDTITSASAIVDPTGELGIDTVETFPTLVKVWLSAGIDGGSYKIEVTIQTAGGRTGQVEFKIRVREA